MRTTVDIPDPLFRRAKATAALQGKSLKRFVTEAIEDRLRREADGKEGRSRVQLPLVPSTRPGAVSLSGGDLSRALEEEELDAAAGH